MPTRPPSSPSPLADSWVTAESVDSESGASSSHANDTDEVLIGTTLLDSYKVERVLGEGGMGRIYEAQHTRIAEKRFAIKVLRPELISSSQVRARFQREIEAVARITHPGVLTIIDVGTTDRGWPFMVCEYLNGLDLLRYIRRFGALQDERVVHMGCRIAEALEATHAHGVIHRDVKPSNVFLLGAFEPLGPEWDRVKLIDFGLSRFVSRDDQLSKSGVVMGTPAYMSPEQARGGRTDHLTDVYGVGAVLYAAATGVPPFREETQQQTLIAVMSREPARPRELNPAISEQLELVIQRAMSKQPEKRHPSMSALRLELSNLEQRGSSRAAGRSDETGEGLGVRWRFLALASSALVLGLAALASVLSGFLALTGETIRLATNERAALALSLGVAVGLALLAVWRFQRRSWGDTAKISDWLPRLRLPVLTALVVYGLASFGVRLGDEVIAHVPASGALSRAPRVDWPGWSALLASLALFGGAAAALHQSWWRPMRPPQRWAWGLTLATGIVLGSLAFARFGFLWHGAGSIAQADGVPDTTADSDRPALANAALPVLSELAAPDGGTADAATTREPLDSTDSVPPTSAPALARDSADPPTVEVAALAPVPAVPAPSPALTAVAREEVARPPTNRRDPESLEALALAQASRPAELADAVETLTRLLALSPGRAADPDVQQILRKAAASPDGEASRAAFRVMSESMGSRGPDLLYELMVDNPELAEKAKFRLTRFKVRRLFSPQLSIAFDLRFFETCAGRLSLLSRANELGDQRSINVLSALVTPPEHCGKGGSPCAAPCQREAVPFARSIETMVQRLRTGQRAASAR